MENYKKVYKAICVGNGILHGLLVIFILCCSFWPFREGENFYQVFNGFFNSGFGAIEPVFILFLLFAAGVFSFLAIRRPAFSLATAAFSFIFFVMAVFPYSVEAVVAGLTSPWLGSAMADYQQGFHLIGNAGYVLYWELAFVPYTLISSFIINNSKTKKGGNCGPDRKAGH